MEKVSREFWHFDSLLLLNLNTKKKLQFCGGSSINFTTTGRILFTPSERKLKIHCSEFHQWLRRLIHFHSDQLPWYYPYCLVRDLKTFWIVRDLKTFWKRSHNFFKEVWDLFRPWLVWGKFLDSWSVYIKCVYTLSGNVYIMSIYTNIELDIHHHGDVWPLMKDTYD
jgi:hypothetical protein